MKEIIKKIILSKYFYSITRRLYFEYFKLKGGFGGYEAVNYMKELNKTEYASLDELKKIQSLKLQKLIQEVYNYVPYYKKIMDNKGIKPSDIKKENDLKLLPVLTKDIIRDNFNDLINKKYQLNNMELITTGGTTGKPMKFYFGKHEIGIRSAHWERWKKLAGVEKFEKFMYIGMDENAKNNPQYDGTITLFNFYLMASFGIDDKLMHKYLKKILDYKPLYLRGYASACYLLADFFKRNDIKYKLKAVLTSSDMLYPYQRKVIEDVFCCKVFDHYGQVEDIVTANECELHKGYHINMESCIIEILDESGKNLSEGNSGRIIGTQLENYSMPLIRYDIGDIGTISNEKCQCGRSHTKITNLDGRKDDWIVTPEGKRVGVQINQTMEKLYDEILETQFLQDKKDLLLVKIVPSDKFKSSTEHEFEKEIRKQVGSLIKIEFKIASNIPKTSGGKHKLIVSSLD